MPFTSFRPIHPEQTYKKTWKTSVYGRARCYIGQPYQMTSQFTPVLGRSVSHVRGLRKADDSGAMSAGHATLFLQAPRTASAQLATPWTGCACWRSSVCLSPGCGLAESTAYALYGGRRHLRPTSFPIWLLVLSIKQSVAKDESGLLFLGLASEPTVREDYA